MKTNPTQKVKKKQRKRKENKKQTTPHRNGNASFVRERITPNYELPRQAADQPMTSTDRHEIGEVITKSLTVHLPPCR